MTRYEYDKIPQRRRIEDDLVHLNELGQGGWQVVAVVPGEVDPKLTREVFDQLSGYYYLIMRETPCES